MITIDQNLHDTFNTESRHAFYDAVMSFIAETNPEQDLPMLSALISNHVVQQAHALLSHQDQTTGASPAMMGAVQAAIKAAIDGGLPDNENSAKETMANAVFETIANTLDA